MTETIASLGPLHLLDGRWVVGDVRRPDGCWVEFREDGLYEHERGGEGQLIPWGRIMLAPHITLGAKYPDNPHYGLLGLLGGLPGPWRGRGGGYLHLTLRHPYEDWLARFDRHPHRYPLVELLLLEELLRQTAAAREAHLLGDPEWLGAVVGRLAPQRPWAAGAIRAVVSGARQPEQATEA
ncbi:hypothetical protein [Streptomyces sp. V3I7]|uniref:hypothetical protein n=1 Tax=Streptomyces sp. V3I7 TaxID=3042278 RepID=UPI00277E5732|nr:hypothetical protein [Streptomyces sp. V3I7]MDQ0991016.1 hypothetical protein [Streptomyces sp. V3I7]